MYFVAFLVALNQFVPLLGEHGLLPVPEWVKQVPFRASPSIFYLFPTDTAFNAAAWFGLALSLLPLCGLAQRAGSWASAAVWAALWVLYLSFVNVGQTVLRLRLGDAPSGNRLSCHLPRRPLD